MDIEEDGTLVPRRGNRAAQEREHCWIWQRLSLTTQFGVLAAVIVVGAMAILGEWLSAQIADNQLRSRSESAALYMEGFLARHVETSETGPSVSEARRKELDSLLDDADLARRIESLRVWRRDGQIIYSTDKDLIGKTFQSANLAKAFAGNVIVHLEYGHDDEGEEASASTEPLIEIYAPIYRPGTKEIIAVGEVYETAQDFIEKRNSVQRRTWLLVSATTLGIFGSLFLIVRRANGTIVSQRSRLKQQLAEAQALAQQNEELRRVADKARLDAIASNETFLNRLGSDLHDGPIQLLGLLILRLGADGMSGSPSRTPVMHPAQDLAPSAIASQVFNQLRDLSTGLVMPEITNLSLQEALQLAVDRHQFTTGSPVETDYIDLPAAVPHPLKICLYRVVQEGLNNAFRHAGGIDQRVVANGDQATITITVSDGGPGLSKTSAQRVSPSLGLVGIHNRVLSFNGTVEILERPGQGTQLIVNLPLDGSRH